MSATIESIESIYERWEREMAQLSRDPDPALIASLEAQARAQGVDLLEICEALTAAIWDEALHPRGHDGRFIELGGIVRLLNFKVAGKDGKTYDFNGHRGKVLGITPDKKSDKLPPDIRVGVLRPDQSDDDQPSTIITVKPNNVEQAPEKARLTNIPAEPEPINPEDLEEFEGEDLAEQFGPNNSTLTPEEVSQLAGSVQSGEPIQVDPVDIDDVVDSFADSPDPVDLTLVPPFDKMRASGIPRSQMPQIPPDRLNQFQDRLREAGFDFGPAVIDPMDLSATQSELDGSKVGGIMRAARAGDLDLLGNPMWISTDGHVLDGHHRWAAALALSANCGGCVEIPVIRVDLPMSDLLAFANAFNDEAGVERLAFGETRESEERARRGSGVLHLVAAGTPLPEPDEDGYFGMATDAEDGITDEDLETLPHGDGSAFAAENEEPPFV